VSWTSAVFLTSLLLMPAETHDSAWAAALLLLATLVATAVLAVTAAAALRRAEAGQRHEATHDALTGLANRRRLLDVLRHDRLHRAGRGRRALVLLDLDGFKAVNDRYGHAAGDALLQAVAQRLLALVGADDLVCRLGGDEFALVLHDLAGAEQALEVASRITTAASEVRSPRPSGDLRAGPARGCACGRAPGSDPATSCADADAALYASKREGQARPHLWTVGMRHYGASSRSWPDDLRQALLTGQLHLVYQPGRGHRHAAGARHRGPCPVAAPRARRRPPPTSSSRAPRAPASSPS
jgi:diguanylate cyclase (GGDEF)-like protein